MATFSTFSEAAVVINSTGGTTNGKFLLRLEEAELTWDREVYEGRTYDVGNQIVRIPGPASWSVTASGYLTTDAGEAQIDNPSSGHTFIVDTMTGYDLLEIAKNDNTIVTLFLKEKTGEYQQGSAIITNLTHSGSMSDFMRFSVTFQGTGKLEKKIIS